MLTIADDTPNLGDVESITKDIQMLGSWDGGSSGQRQAVNPLYARRTPAHPSPYPSLGVASQEYPYALDHAL